MAEFSDLNGAGVVLVAWFILGALVTIARVGKAREPVTPTDAAVATALFLGLIILVLVASG